MRPIPFSIAALSAAESTVMTLSSLARVARIIDAGIRSESFSNFCAERVESGGYARPGSDRRDRFNRCYDAAADGADGSTHREAIQDMRDFFGTLIDDKRNVWGTVDRLSAAIDAHFDDLERWHEAHGSIDEQIG